MAVTYGTGRDDYLGVVLAYVSSEDDEMAGEKYVTWIWNSAAGCEGFSDGHYMHRAHKGDDLERVAWEDFAERSRRFQGAYSDWDRWEREERKTGR